MVPKIFKYHGFMIGGYLFLMFVVFAYTGDIAFDKPEINIHYPSFTAKNATIVYNVTAATSTVVNNSNNSSIYVQRQDKAPSAEYYNQTYTWSYDGYTTEYSIGIPGELVDYYRNQTHTSRNFSKYALSDKDRASLNKTVTTFQDLGEKRGYSKDENVMNIIAFIQSMPYTSDSVTTGYDEYPRYPLETLADGGGDCEDTVILAAALIHEMGYGVVLLEFPRHMALGVAGSENITGSYYEYNGTRYFYVETTSAGHKFGVVPDGVDANTAKIHPLKK